MTLSLSLFVLFGITLMGGKLIDKIRIPWVFSALFLGLVLSVFNPIKEITSSDNFTFLAELGMYFLLFIIGFDLNIKEIIHEKKLIFKTSVAVIAAETLAGMLFVHYLFDLSWLISVIVATSFATVGEAILLPILDEFKLTRTRFGQLILGIGAFDDIFEIILIAAIAILMGQTLDGVPNVWEMSVNLISLGLLLALPILFMLVANVIKKKHFHFKKISSLFLLALTVLFLFIGIGEFAEAAALGALLAGVSLKLFLNPAHIKSLEQEVRAVAYGFFIPIFFLSVGVEIDV